MPARVDQFRGVMKDTAPHAIPHGFFQEDIGGDRSFRGVWRRRRGMARSTAATLASAPTSMIGFETPGESYALLAAVGATLQGFNDVGEQPGASIAATSLATGLSPNHRGTMAEFRRIAYWANGWNSMRAWDGLGTTADTAGIEGPSRNQDSWAPSPAAQETADDYATRATYRRFRYRYLNSKTGQVSNPSVEVGSGDATYGSRALVTDPNEILFSSNVDTLRFLIGAAGSVTGPHATGLAFSGHTITRDSGSWITDGFSVGDYVTLASCENTTNNGTWGPITALTATVMTIAGGPVDFTTNADDTTATWQRAAKGRIQASTDPNVDTIVLEATGQAATPTVFNEQLYGPDSTGLAITASTVTRSAGSWIADGFRVGDFIQLATLELPNARHELFGPITSLTDTVLEIAGQQFTANAADTTAQWRRWVLEKTGADTVWYEAARALNTASYIDFDKTDAELSDTPLTWPDYGHDPPPVAKNVISYRDRLWLFGQVAHSTGNASFTNGSVNVAEGATDPDWNTEVLGSAEGEASVTWFIQKDGDTTAYEISYYDAPNNRIILKSAYNGTTSSDSGYTIFSRSNVIWASNPGYPEAFKPLNFVNGPNNEGAGDLTAGVGFGGSVVFFSPNGMYRFTWDTDPFVDGFMVPLSSKAGALSQHVVVEVQGTVYTMDRRGWHAWDGGFPRLISRPLGELRDLIDYDQADKFHACFLPDSRAIRWWVCYSGETYPKHYVQYDIEEGTWSTGEYLHELSASRLLTQGDGLRLFLADSSGHTWWGDTGDADGCPVANSHLTAAAGASGTSIPVDETLPTTGVGLAGCYLTKRTAAGVSESRRIASNTANTITLASAFSVDPADGDALWVGIIPSTLKTRAFGPKNLSGKVQVDYLTIAFDPVTSTRYLQVRIYENYSATKKAWGPARGSLSGLVKPGVNASYPSGDWLVDLSKSDGLVTIPIGMEWNRYFEVELTIDEPDADFNLIAMEVGGIELREVGV